ncbi:MAG: hypothetical protein K0R67_1630 [Paenibacillus sp.]|nr:hypothetical protein [Paenibacillus sp.]
MECGGDRPLLFDERVHITEQHRGIKVLFNHHRRLARELFDLNLMVSFIKAGFDAPLFRIQLIGFTY